MNLDALRAFVKVAELGSFTRAAEQLGLPKSRVSLLVKALERDLDARLLHRTTRAVHTTADGEQLLLRGRALVDEADEVAAMFQATSALAGRVRIDLPIALARGLVIPRLPELVARHPLLELVLSTTDRRVELVREGFDLVLRIGVLASSGLGAKRLGSMPVVSCASPAYLRRHGVPRSLADLAHHHVVHYSLTLSDEPSFDYRKGGRDVAVPMRSLVTVNNTDAYTGACLAGLGIIQAPRYGLADRLRRGELIEVLPTFTSPALPVALVHGHGAGTALPKRVRAVMSWLQEVVAPALAVH